MQITIKIINRVPVAKASETPQATQAAAQVVKLTSEEWHRRLTNERAA